jgi:hypothetical protein
VNSPSSPKSNIDIKAVILGFLTDTVATIAISTLLITAMAAAGIPENSIPERMRTVSGLLLSLIFGLGCTVLGGYVAGRVAKRTEVVQGAVVGGVSLILGLLLRESGQPLWYEIVGFVAIIPAGIAGGRIAAERHKRMSAEEH